MRRLIQLLTAASVALAVLLLAPPLGAQARNLIYVSNEGSNSISVIDTKSTFRRTIPVGSRPRGIAVSPDGKRVYVALSDNVAMKESSGDRIAVIDAQSGKVIARYSSGSDPEQFGITPDGRVLYASNEDAGLASAIDLR